MGTRAGAEQIEDLLPMLAVLPVAGSDGGLIDQIAMLERVKSAASAAQVRATAAFAASQRVALTRAGVSTSDAGRSIGSQIALARRDSPARGSRHLGFAEALSSDMPETLAALTRGDTSEWRATLVVRETAVLSREHRRLVDAELAPILGGLGDLRTEREARRIGLRLDVEAAGKRAKKAVQGSRVTIRPLPDCMVSLNAVLPVADGVEVYATISAEADLGRVTVDADGVPKGRGRRMADALVQRILTGGAEGADAGHAATARPSSVEVQVVITDHSLLTGGSEPAEIAGYGPTPADRVRELIADHLDGGATVFARRLFTDPAGRLIAAESRRRLFPRSMATYIRVRDGGICRTPWCNAPIRHIDHTRSAAEGGRTTLVAGDGLCARCNNTKQAPGWRYRAGPVDIITVSTPTGHRHDSRPPPLPGAA